jgi:hypothetical protein
MDTAGNLFNYSEALCTHSLRQACRKEPFPHMIVQLIFVAPGPSQVRLENDIERMVLSIEANHGSPKWFLHVHEVTAEPTPLIVIRPEQ